jgi:hypothetical protein
MARVDHLTDGIYRISTYAPEKRISFNRFLIDDDEPALIHTGTFPMYADVRAAVARVLSDAQVSTGETLGLLESLYSVITLIKLDDITGFCFRPGQWRSRLLDFAWAGRTMS